MVKAQHPTGDPVVQQEHAGVLDTRVSRRSVLKAAGLGAGAAALATVPVAAASRKGATATGAGKANQVKGGTIRLGAFEGGLVDGLLPWKSFGQEFFWNWSAQPLVSIAPDGSILYDLATGFEVSEDGLTYTFSLVEGATWHDGTPVTAADVAFTYNTGLKATTGEPSEPCVQASTTLALDLPKVGVVAMAARPYVGELYLADLGIPRAVYEQNGVMVGPTFSDGPIVRLRR